MLSRLGNRSCGLCRTNCWTNCCFRTKKLLLKQRQLRMNAKTERLCKHQLQNLMARFLIFTGTERSHAQFFGDDNPAHLSQQIHIKPIIKLVIAVISEITQLLSNGWKSILSGRQLLGWGARTGIMLSGLIGKACSETKNFFFSNAWNVSKHLLALKLKTR